MGELIKIIQPNTCSFPISMGERTQELISRFKKLDDEEKETLLSETTDILSHCINPVETIGSVTNLTVGYVQSGKTMSFTTLSALAIDNGFRIIIYLAGVKNNLLTQTTERLKKDLLNNGANSKHFKMYDNPTVENNSQNIRSNLQLSYKPAILITVLKHSLHIDHLSAIFSDHQIKQALGNNGVLIIDDEADQASLNTYARKNSKKSNDWDDEEFSAIYASIVRLKGKLPNHSYIQYTATPQGPLLINLMDLLSPKHHTVLTPGKKYTGGKTFFKDRPQIIMEIPPDQVYHEKRNKLTECPQSLIDALQIYLLGVAIVVHIEERENFLSMMIHADSKNDASRKFFRWVKGLIDLMSATLDKPMGDPSRTELTKEFYNNYQEIMLFVETKHSFESIMEKMLDTIRDTNLELVIQGSKQINWDNATSHVLVGAEMLNRGFTVENLSVTYMPRYSVGKSTADTIQQRCRFFGYKLNYIDVCRVYLPLDSAVEYSDYVDHEEIMRKWLVDFPTLEEVEHQLILDERMNATRKNILSDDVVQSKLSGWRQMNALQNIEENKVLVEEFLHDKDFKYYNVHYHTKDRNHKYIKVEINQAIEFLKDFKVPNVPDALRKSATMQYLKYLATNNNLSFIYFIQMAYDSEFRERSLNLDKMKISNIFSGADPSGSDIYPGDKSIKFDDSICIQIHKIRLKHDHSSEWNKKLCYTLGFYYPEDFAISYVGSENN
ncbi:MAG: Z1 domain-containing protein [Bacteroidota bacterium]